MISHECPLTDLAAELLVLWRTPGATEAAVAELFAALSEALEYSKD